MGKARRKVAEVEFGEHAADLNEQLSPRTGARRSVGSTFEDDASTPRLCVGEIVDGVVANQIHSQKERLGHYWAGALVMQLVLYTVVYSCYSKDAVTDGRAGNATSLLVQDAISDGNDGAGVEQGPPPGELLVQFMTFMCVAYQVREIPKHIAAGKDNEAEWLESDRLADKLKAIKRLQWHQRMCFVPQPLMVMGALIASMGAAVLLSKYADCERGIMAGLAVLDATGMALLIMVVGSISIVIACFWMTTRIHFASYKYLADSEAMADYIAETSTTPRGDSVRTIESNGIHKWFTGSLCLQSLIIFILSKGTTAASESGVPGALSVSSTLFIVIGGGVFHVGCQTGALGDYYSQVRLWHTLSQPLWQLFSHYEQSVLLAEPTTRALRRVPRKEAHGLAPPEHVLTFARGGATVICCVPVLTLAVPVLHKGGESVARKTVGYLCCHSGID